MSHSIAEDLVSVIASLQLLHANTNTGLCCDPNYRQQQLILVSSGTSVAQLSNGRLRISFEEASRRNT